MKSLLPSLGGLAGSMIGGPGGALIGSSAGKLISAITGYGDYKVNRNSVSNGNSIPTFRTGGDGMRVCHREFLRDVTGSIGFASAAVIPINPGLTVFGPWVAQVAVNFEEWDVDGLVFEYRPSSGNAISGTNAALGVVILATDYDILNTPFSSKQQAESYEFSSSVVPSMGCMHPVECMRGRNVLDNRFVRTGNVPTGADQRMYDLGNFQVITQGMQSANTVGELWVSYDIMFRKPRIPSAPTITYAHLREGALTSASTANPYGSTGAVLSANTTMLVTPSGTNAFILPLAGTYFIEVTMFGGSGAFTGGLSFSLGGNITAPYNWFGDNTSNSIGGFTASVKAFIVLGVQVVSPGSGAANTLTLIAPGTFLNGYNDTFIFPGLPTSLMAPRCSPPLSDTSPSDEKDWVVEGRERMVSSLAFGTLPFAGVSGSR
jgi:hypothetical protein